MFRFGLCAAALGIALGVAACANKPAPPPPPVAAPAPTPVPIAIDIALIIPTAANKALSEQLAAGARLAVEDINARRSRIQGAAVTLRLASHDEGASLGEAASAAQRIAASPVLAVIGHSNLTMAAVAIPSYRNAGLALLAPVLTHARLTDNSSGYVLRMLTSDTEAAHQLGAYAASALKVKRVAVVSEPQGQGIDLSNPITDGVCSSTCMIVSRTTVNAATINADAAKLGAALQAIRRARPDAVIFSGNTETAAALLRQMQANKLSTPVLSGANVCTADLLKTVGALRVPVYCARSERDAPADFAARVQARQKQTPATQADGNVAYAAYAYDAVGTIFEALKTIQLSGNTERDRAALLTALRTVKHAGVMGEIAFQANGELQSADTAIYTFKNDTLRQVALVTKDVAAASALAPLR